MTLGFSTKIGEWETRFPEKIWAGIIDKTLITEVHKVFAEYDLASLAVHHEVPKLHSIRVDAHGRWKAGMKIHFVTGNRTKNRRQFAPVIQAICVQHIEIRNVFLDKTVLVDDKKLCKWEIHELALNDGFDSVDQFWAYFGQADFEGQIIHWTDLRY
jgi:hypothetical protein